VLSRSGLLQTIFGRVKTIAACAGLLSIFTALAGLAQSPTLFCAMRFVAGLGMGGVTAVTTPHMAECAPSRIRARLVVLVFAGYSIGGVVVALLGKELIDSRGWQSVFYAAAAPALLIPLMLRTMPESLPFLLQRGRTGELRTAVRQLAPGMSIDEATVFFNDELVISGKSSVRQLFEDGRALSTLMLWVAFVTGLFMVYALSSWLTKLMSMNGYTLGSALTFTLIFNCGAAIGSLAGAWVGDRSNIKYVLFGFYILGAASLYVMGFTKSTSALFGVVLLVGASTLGTQVLAYAFAGSFYPSSMRSTGVGMATGVGRLGAILGPVLIGFLVSLELPMERNFTAIAAAGLIGAFAVLLIDSRL
jgi:MFS transporter, AAHS family, benzoate transport protein